MITGEQARVIHDLVQDIRDCHQDLQDASERGTLAQFAQAEKDLDQAVTDFENYLEELQHDN